LGFREITVIRVEPDHAKAGRRRDCETPSIVLLGWSMVQVKNILSFFSAAFIENQRINDDLAFSTFSTSLTSSTHFTIFLSI
jgi:hypothetical protein